MKIKMLRLACGPAGNFETGRTYNVSDMLGQAFIQAGAALEVKAAAPDAAAAKVEDAPEQAVQVSRLTAEKALGVGAKRKKH